MLTKAHLVKAMVFPVVIYGCESWTIKKAKHWRIDNVVLEKTIKSPLDCKESILKETSPERLLEGLMLKLKLQYLATWCEELTHWKRLWWWERLRAGGEGDDRGWNGWMASLTPWTWVWSRSGSWWWTGNPGLLQSMGLQRVRHDWAPELNRCYLSKCIRTGQHRPSLKGVYELLFAWIFHFYSITLEPSWLLSFRLFHWSLGIWLSVSI